MRLLFLTLMWVPLGSGCSTANPQRAWVRKHGGLADQHLQRRAELERARLIADVVDTPVVVQVLATDAVCAYSWRDGQVYVTRGLVDRLSEDELAAAIAHEVGHLLDDEHAESVVSLQGLRGSLDAEERADAWGVRLLERQGIGPAAMSTMLTKVLRSCRDHARRDALGRRLRRLDARPL